MYIISPEVLVTHTKELGQILEAVHQTSTNLGRTASIPTAIAIAQLALKHRQNKNFWQRMIIFVGLPHSTMSHQTTDVERALVRLAKKLKKNVALDVIVFGDDIEQASKDTASSVPLSGTRPRPTALTSSNPIVSLSSMHKLTCMVWCHALFCSFPDITSPSHLTHTSSS
jgi:hypothetical protein